MRTYAGSAVPWGRVVLAACLVVVLMDLVAWNPWVLWPLEGIAVGLLAGAAAWCFDETAAVVVDAAPRSLAWRAVARSPAVLLLVLAWGLGVLRVGNGTAVGHMEAIFEQGLVAIAVGAAFASWRRAEGEPVPGLLFATAVVPSVTAWALVRPFDEHLAVFPFVTTSAHGWQMSVVGWTGVGLLAGLLLVAALTDVPWWAARARAGTRRGNDGGWPEPPSRPKGAPDRREAHARARDWTRRHWPGVARSRRAG